MFAEGTSRAAAFAATTLMCTTPTWAATVESNGTLGLLPDPVLDVSIQDGPSVDPGLVLLDIDPEGASASAVATNDGPGTVTVSDVASVEGTITNTLDQAVSVLVGYDVFWDVEVTLDGPGEEGFGSFLARFLVDGEQVGGDSGGGQLTAPECSSFPCNDFFFDANRPIAGIDLAAGQIASVLFTSEVDATAIAPIPLPAALGPAALALGALAWAGRRRRGRG